MHAGIKKRTLPYVVAVMLAAPASAQTGNDPGKQLFVKDTTPACAICHTLADAGASGSVGPSLDELKPDAPRVVKAVKTGLGAMPPYPQLSEEQVQALATLSRAPQALSSKASLGCAPAVACPIPRQREGSHKHWLPFG